MAEGRVMCDVCAEKHDVEQDKRRKAWKEAGKCTRCGGETDGQHVQCQSCREYMAPIRALAAREWRARKAEEGKCTLCGKVWAEPGRRLCKKCAEKHRSANNKPEYRVREKAKRQARIEAGLCVDCGAVAIVGQRRCERCRNLQRDRTRKYSILRRIKKEAEQARMGVYRV